jgi:cytochrome c oxidase subunit II
MNRRKLFQLVSAAAVASVVGLRPRMASAAGEQVVRLTAKKFEYSPNEITVKKGKPVVIEIVSLDRKHGFTLPEFKVRTDVKPGQTNVVRFTPDKVGRFNFHCDLFCGDGHEDMSGTLIVVES